MSVEQFLLSQCLRPDRTKEASYPRAIGHHDVTMNGTSQPEDGATNKDDRLKNDPSDRIIGTSLNCPLIFA